jgi:hypothetical protein
MTNVRAKFESVNRRWAKSASSNAIDAFSPVGLARRLDLLQHIRVTADCTLPEYDQAAREDVCALDGDHHREAACTQRR